jgi:hypothetical protein
MPDEAGPVEHIVISSHGEECCREHRHEPDSKHFAHLVLAADTSLVAAAIGSAAHLLHHSD